MIDKNTVNAILEAADIVEVVGEFISLKPRGTNHWACCPFHGEKTPSFSVSRTRGIYKCFGCGAAGNVVRFVMEHERMSYYEALKYLARKYGIEVRERELTQEEQRVNNNRESMMVVSSYAQDVFCEQLWNTPDGQAIGLSYFRERGFTDKTIRKFQLGYSLDHRTAFSDKALKDGYKAEFLVATGLSLEKEDGRLVDRFAGRVMFPIHSLSGRVTAFGARTLRQDKNVAKYMNSPESEIYSKSFVLYGIFQAKNAIGRAQKCYLVEGYTDVISMHQAGVENVVASSGTALTTEQVRLIKRFTSNVTVLYDGDAAGIKASLRGIDMLLEAGLNVKVALFPNGEDPDSFARKNTNESFVAFLQDNEKDFISFKTKLLGEEAKSDPLKQAELIREIVRSIGAIPDAITRTVYVKECSRLMDIDENVLLSEVTTLRRKKLYADKAADQKTEAVEEEEKAVPTTAALPGFIDINRYFEKTEEEILYYLLKFGSHHLFTTDNDYEKRAINVAEYIISELLNDELEFKNLHYRALFEEYCRLMPASDEEQVKHFINHPDNQISETAIRLLDDLPPLTVEGYKSSQMEETALLPLTIPKIILVYKSRISKVASDELSAQLKQAQETNDQEQVQLLMERLRVLQKFYMELAIALKRVIL
jgi:DNA primase